MHDLALPGEAAVFFSLFMGVGWHLVYGAARSEQKKTATFTYSHGLMRPLRCAVTARNKITRCFIVALQHVVSGQMNGSTMTTLEAASLHQHSLNFPPFLPARRRL
jgi:hypothetical protein